MTTTTPTFTPVVDRPAVDGPEACRRGHDRTRQNPSSPSGLVGYTDRHGRSRCTECDGKARLGPLTEARRAPRSYSDEWATIFTATPRRLKGALSRLSQREQNFIKVRFGLDRTPRRPRTMRETGEVMAQAEGKTGAYSRQWVEQVERRSRNILREALAA